MYVQTVVTLLAQAVAAVGTGGAFNAAKVALFKAPGLPGRTKTLADFDIVDFGGLTNLKSLVWGSPFVNANQQAEIQAGLTSWLTTGITGLPVTIAGYLITNTAGDTLLLAELFPTPVTFDRSGQNLSGVPRLVFDT